MHGFHNYNRIIHHDTNRKNQRKQGKQVNRETEQLHKKESTDDGNRNGNGRDQRRSEILEENKYHQEYKDKRFDQGFFHLFDGGIQEIFSAENGERMNSLWKFGFGVFHHGIYSDKNIIRVGPGCLKNAKPCSSISLDERIGTVCERTELHAGNIF